MLAITFSLSPAQVLMSMPNTRFRRRAQHMATWRGMLAADPTVCWRHCRPKPAVRREHAMESDLVHPRRRHEGRQSCHQLQWLQHTVRGPIAVRVSSS